MSLLEDFAQAIKEGDSTRVESLLANDSVDVNARLPRKKNSPALVFAAELERKDVVDVLLRFGARIDDTDDDGRTACHFAAIRHHDLLASLLAHRPNLALENGRGRTSLQVSLNFGDVRISEMLIEAGAPLDGVDRRQLCQLAAKSTSAIQTLLRRGVVISELRDNERFTPLHFAASVKTPDSVLRTLVNACGVDLEARNERGDTCMHLANRFGNDDALSFFIAAGANLQALDNLARTPLHSVCDEACTILLLAAGADVHARDVYGRTPSLKTALNESQRPVPVVRSIVNVMLAADADLDAVDRNGRTARQVLLADSQMTFDDAQPSKEVAAARRRIAKARLDFVRLRAWQVCIGLQSRGLDALQTCEILLHACGPVAPVVAFHHWWKIATTVKHFTPFK
jgi:ankyrin repeat protein